MVFIGYFYIILQLIMTIIFAFSETAPLTFMLDWLWLQIDMDWVVIVYILILDEILCLI